MLSPRIRQMLMMLNAGAIGVGLSFANSVLLVKLLGADAFGQYAYLVAIVSILPTFYETFNRSIVRFMGELNERRQLRLLIFILGGKIAVFAVAITLFIAWYFFLGDSKLFEVTSQSLFAILLVAVLLSLPVKLVGNVFRSVLNAHERYRSVAFLLLIPTVTPVVINGWLLATGASVERALAWLAIELLLTPAIALVVSFGVLRRIGWVDRMRQIRVRSYRGAFVFGYTHYFRPYGQPLSISIVSQYIKQYLPLVILGQVSTFSNVAYFRVLSSIGDLGIEFFPSVANAMLPSVSKNRTRDSQGFAARFTRHGAVYLGLMGVGLLVFVLMHPWIFWLYDLDTNAEISLAVLLTALMVMQAALGFLVHYLYLLGGDTKGMYFVSPANSVFYVFALAALTPYLIVGLVLARLLHRAFGGLLLAYLVVVRHRYIAYRHYGTLVGLTCLVSFILVGAYWIAF